MENLCQGQLCFHNFPTTAHSELEIFFKSNTIKVLLFAICCLCCNGKTVRKVSVFLYVFFFTFYLLMLRIFKDDCNNVGNERIRCAFQLSLKFGEK